MTQTSYWQFGVPQPQPKPWPETKKQLVRSNKDVMIILGRIKYMEISEKGEEDPD